MSTDLQWRDLSRPNKAYLLGVYIAAVPSAYFCLAILPGEYTLPWIFLTLASLLIASVNLQLPKNLNVVISMGDVFTILALIHFGPGPALVTYWVDVTTATVTDYGRRFGIRLFPRIFMHRFLFNLASSALSVLTMGLLYVASMNSSLTFPANMTLGLLLVAVSWFLVNTVVLAIAVSFWSGRPFMAVWRHGMGLYLLNFFGSAAFAGLISLFYRQADVYVFILAVTVCMLVYWLYRFHAKQYEQAQEHIAELNELYQQSVQTQEAQRRSEQRYRSLVEAASDAIFSLQPDGCIMSLNSAFQRITGWTCEEWIGRQFDGLMHADDREAASDILRGVFQGETLLLSDLRLQRKTEEYVFVECTMTPQFQDGQVIGLLGIARDMTERKRLENALLQSQKMEAVGRLAGGVAHDFNNLLVLIIGYSDLLLESVDDSSEIRPKLEEIKRAGERAAALTRQLLAFSRKQIIQPVAVNLNTTVKHMDKMLRRVIGEDIELVNVLQSSLGTVKADPGQIEQVILNLAVNSRDAMSSGGRLTIGTLNVAHAQVCAAIQEDARPGPYVMLEMSDTGCGIAPEIRPYIFEPFFTTKEPGKGTGLGLATVYGIVNQSAGYIVVSSAPGQGVSFKIFLPRVAGKQPEAAVRRTLASAPTGETVLLVEDDDAVRGLASEILSRSGYNVFEARDPADAVQLAKEHTGTIHVLVTDVVMPRMSGRQLAEHVEAIRPDIRVLFMSGYADDVISHHGILDPATAFLQKPFSPEALASKVRELLDGPAIREKRDLG